MKYRVIIGEQIKETDSLALARQVIHILAEIDVIARIEMNCPSHGWSELEGVSCKHCKDEFSLFEAVVPQLQWAITS